MKRILFSITFIILSVTVSAQHDFFILKKGNRNKTIYMRDSYIAFQLKDHQWYAGMIKSIVHDSFYIRPLEINYGFTYADTLSVDLAGFAIGDVYAMPKDGVQIHYVNGAFAINHTGGHVHWYWVKSGWIFRFGAAGYAGLTMFNGLIHHDLAGSGPTLAIAAAVFAFGELLNLNYRLTWRMSRKYHLEYIGLSK